MKSIDKIASVQVRRGTMLTRGRCGGLARSGAIVLTRRTPHTPPHLVQPQPPAAPPRARYLLQAKVDAVTGVMQKNIESALKNTDRIEDIDEKAVVLADSAKQFKNSAGAAKRLMRCRYWKMVRSWVGGLVGWARAPFAGR